MPPGEPRRRPLLRFWFGFGRYPSASAATHSIALSKLVRRRSKRVVARVGGVRVVLGDARASGGAPDRASGVATSSPRSAERGAADVGQQLEVSRRTPIVRDARCDGAGAPVPDLARRHRPARRSRSWRSLREPLPRSPPGGSRSLFCTAPRSRRRRGRGARTQRRRLRRSMPASIELPAPDSTGVARWAATSRPRLRDGARRRRACSAIVLATAPARARGVVRIGSGLAAPRLVRRIEPAYPALAVAAALDGDASCSRPRWTPSGTRGGRRGRAWSAPSALRRGGARGRAAVALPAAAAERRADAVHPHRHCALRPAALRSESGRGRLRPATSSRNSLKATWTTAASRPRAAGSRRPSR